MEQLTVRIQAARMRSVLHEVSRATRITRSVTVLAYAAVGLTYPGQAPRTPEDLARCIQLIREHDWMQERAFDYLSRIGDGAWPYLIAAWSDLSALVDGEIEFPVRAGCYAPKTAVFMHQILSRRCNKPYCNHSVDHHTQNHGRCDVDGCKCGYFLKGE